MKVIGDTAKTIHDQGIDDAYRAEKFPYGLARNRCGEITASDEIRTAFLGRKQASEARGPDSIGDPNATNGAFC